MRFISSILALSFISSVAIAEAPSVKRGRLSVDPLLEEWFKQHEVDLGIENSDAEELPKDLDELTRYYLSLKGMSKNVTRSEALASASAILESLKLYLDQKKASHPLQDYILAELRGINSVRDQVSELSQISSFKSCVQRSEFARVPFEKSLAKKDKSEIKDWLSEVDSYGSVSFKRGQFKKLLGVISLKQQEEFSPILLPYVQKYSWLAELTPWIHDPEANASVAVSRLVAKNECEAAKQRYIVWLASDGTKGLETSTVLETVGEVGRCFRKNGVDARIAALRDFAPVLEAKFGFEGKVAIASEVARAYWALDRFTEAREVLAGLFSEGLAQNKIGELGAAQLLLAQIYENEHRVEDAIINFEFYLGKYKTSPQAFEAVKSLVLLYSEKQEWIKAAEAAQRLVAIQDALPAEKREVNKAGFGLFWAGRSWLALGEKELASSAWKRLKTEYYSTYYGALGHFLLEASFGQVFDVEVPSNVSFDETKYVFSPFSANDQVRVAAIDIFLKTGLGRQAECEIDELATDRSPSRDYSRALMYAAVGSWLKSVKLYDELPRVFRDTLPRGSERVLFPVRYRTAIENFALRLNMDPDFVISLIRQESLFDKQALSPVGAKGLMQLMEATALMEVKKMGQDYIEKSQEGSRFVVMDNVKNRLFETDTNLMIGIHHVNTLMMKYGSPVFTLSAYNAGPGAMLKWKDKFDTSDLLLFVEKIPYKETNNYVKLILRNYFYYKKWYRDSALSMPHLENVAHPLVKNPIREPGELNQEKSAASL
jgi:tetratricopeptide (TPR) repeat protein